MSCNVCYGTPGLYPIINRYGTELYSIECPECMGSGLTGDEESEAARAASDQQRYIAAMLETHRIKDAQAEGREGGAS